MWVDVNEGSYSGFKQLLLNFNKDFEHYGPDLANLYRSELEKMELDAFNVLYVAMTRAVKALFVITSLNTRGKVAENSYAELFYGYLSGLGIWEESKKRYTFGAFESKDNSSKPPTNAIGIPYLYNKGYLQDVRFAVVSKASAGSKQAQAIQWGDLFHHAMAQIETKDDIQSAIESIRRQNKISLTDEELLKIKISQVVSHSKLEHFFTKKAGVHLNEKEILAADGTIVRPDKIILNGKKAILIDYKTGDKKEEHLQQIRRYSGVLQAMGHKSTKKSWSIWRRIH